ncbi:hypothetical protein C8Q75DRAFT_210648 [Abortiporus biennis]|nr:hypothetical protein C8Q75DRAFT_210648 [Abortiporus biennis]
MDKFVTVKKTTHLAPQAGKVEKEKQRSTFKYNPYPIKKAEERKFDKWKYKKRTEKILEPIYKKQQEDKKRVQEDLEKTKLSNAAVTKHLLNTLSDESNPITHSDIWQRADYVTTAATGHQRGERRTPYVPAYTYNDVRREKLKNQLPDKQDTKEGNVLRNVRVYINGYLDNTTDIEMKRIVALAGGQILQTPSSATHILTSQQLNGSKTHKLLKSKLKGSVHVVRPQWVTDSIDAGQRLSERLYSVLKDETVKDIASMFSAGSSRDRPIELD